MNENQLTTPKQLSSEQKKFFRTIGHHLKPIVTIAGNGLSETVVAELERAFTDHELIKIKLAIDDKPQRTTVVKEISELCKATQIQTIGKIALLYRKNDNPNPRLSNVLRYSVL